MAIFGAAVLRAMEEESFGLCERCGTESPLLWLEGHDYHCSTCWEDTHQCIYCGDFAKKEIPMAYDLNRYCSNCQKEQFNELVECVKRAQKLCKMLGVVQVRASENDGDIHAFPGAWDRIVKLLETGGSTVEHWTGNVSKESIDLDGVEFLCLREGKKEGYQYAANRLDVAELQRNKELHPGYPGRQCGSIR